MLEGNPRQGRPERKKQCAEQIEALREVTMEVDKLAALLEEDLRPVLRQANPSTKEEPEEKQTTTELVEVAELIRESVIITRTTSERLRLILDRLEI